MYWGTLKMVAKCSTWWSNALSSFSEQHWLCSSFSSSPISSPNLLGWSLFGTPLAPGITVGTGEEGITAVGVGKSGEECDWRSEESWNQQYWFKIWNGRDFMGWDRKRNDPTEKLIFQILTSEVTIQVYQIQKPLICIVPLYLKTPDHIYSFVYLFILMIDLHN